MKEELLEFAFPKEVGPAGDISPEQAAEEAKEIRDRIQNRLEGIAADGNGRKEAEDAFDWLMAGRPVPEAVEHDAVWPPEALRAARNKRRKMQP